MAEGGCSSVSLACISGLLAMAHGRFGWRIGADLVHRMETRGKATPRGL